MKDRLVLFTSDRNFLLPTLIAAWNLLKQDAVKLIADVAVVTVGMTTHEVSYLRKLVSQFEIEILNLGDKDLDSQEWTFNKTHVPTSTLARLYTPSLIPSHYTNIVYLDGDIQIVGDLFPLISYDVPSGKLLAAPDRFLLGGTSVGWQSSVWRDDCSYIRSLGIENPDDYFNAGVIAARSETWKDVCDSALEFFKAHSELCRYHDQSALNAVCKGKTLRLSLAYNFSSSLEAINGEDYITPRLLHFTGANKPWFKDGKSPWQSSFVPLYNDFVDRYPDICREFSPAGRPSDAGVERTTSTSARSYLYGRYAIASKRAKLKRFIRRKEFFL
jgi:lipopolysaccharide biosynthesis glycosyltransferase